MLTGPATPRAGPLPRRNVPCFAPVLWPPSRRPRSPWPAASRWVSPSPTSTTITRPGTTTRRSTTLQPPPRPARGRAEPAGRSHRRGRLLHRATGRVLGRLPADRPREEDRRPGHLRAGRHRRGARARRRRAPRRACSRRAGRAREEQEQRRGRLPDRPWREGGLVLGQVPVHAPEDAGRGRLHRADHVGQPDQPVPRGHQGLPGPGHQGGGRERDREGVHRRLRAPGHRPAHRRRPALVPGQRQGPDARPDQRREAQHPGVRRGAERLDDRHRAGRRGQARGQRAGLRRTSTATTTGSSPSPPTPGRRSLTSAHRTASTFTPR